MQDIFRNKAYFMRISRDEFYRLKNKNAIKYPRTPKYGGLSGTTVYIINKMEIVLLQRNFPGALYIFTTSRIHLLRHNDSGGREGGGLYFIYIYLSSSIQKAIC